MAGPIVDLLDNSPDQPVVIAEQGTYAEVLQFVQSAYNESKTENDAEAAEAAYCVVMDKLDAAKRVALALDFSLSQSDWSLNQLGARAILQTKVEGAQLTQTEDDLAVSKLKARLGLLNSASDAGFAFAKSAMEALVWLGKDEGLDVFLTDSRAVRNYQRKDSWTTDSAVTVFESLKTKYENLAAASGNANPYHDRFLARIYELCRLRRLAGKEVKPLQPVVQLESLVP